MNAGTIATDQTGMQAKPAKERPIIISGRNPALILEDRKTQTRRLLLRNADHKVPKPPRGANYYVKENPHNQFHPERRWAFCRKPTGFYGVHFSCPYGEAGDRLRVRETWNISGSRFQGRRTTLFGRYESDQKRFDVLLTPEAISEGVAWCDYQNKSGDKCERCGARLFSDDGEPPWHSPIVEYQLLWDSLHGKGAWEKNPWVWVIEFKRIA